MLSKRRVSYSQVTSPIHGFSFAARQRQQQYDFARDSVNPMMKQGKSADDSLVWRDAWAHPTSKKGGSKHGSYTRDQIKKTLQVQWSKLQSAATNYVTKKRRQNPSLNKLYHSNKRSLPAVLVSLGVLFTCLALFSLYWALSSSSKVAAFDKDQQLSTSEAQMLSKAVYNIMEYSADGKLLQMEDALQKKRHRAFVCPT